jgi:hypothetical protein
VTWDRLEVLAGRLTPGLRPPLPAGDGCCAVCRGPAGPGYARCFQCATHLAEAPGLLADVVVPISYAVRGGRFAAALRLYKEMPGARPGAAAARAWLRALLLVFLRDHGACVWRRGAMPRPARLAVVPGGQGRPGPHPLLAFLAPCLALRHVRLAVRPDEPLGRALNPRRFTADGDVAGHSVLLVDDTWVSGASAQSAAVALRMAGARHVAVVVAGRHIDPADPRSHKILSAMTTVRYDMETCAVHRFGQPDKNGQSAGLP